MNLTLSRTIKKTLLLVAGLSVLLAVIVGVLYFLPNELTFKIYNTWGVSQKDDTKAQELFAKSSDAFPAWDLIAINNSYGRLYTQEKYDELSTKLAKTIDEDCDTNSEKISQYCENIFYLDGLVQYRLGENKTGDEQREFYQNAIDEFQKTLVINTDNKWAKENIDFILQKFSEQQQSKQQSEGEQKDGQNQDGQQDQKKQDGQSQDGQQGENGEQNSQEKGQEQGQGEKSQDGQKGDEVGESRLPQNIQDALEDAQKQMEQDQGQEGFNRSQSAAQKNNYRNQDPLEQMMQQFFGGNMGAIDGQKNFTQEIQNPNEKDW